MTAGEANGGEPVGQVLGGRYRVTATIGRGGMGVVARAVDELLGREVAVKILRVYTDASAPDLADLRARMQREAQAAARIRHSGVVTVHDVTEEQGLPVIVMELVDGPSLDDVLEERGTLEPHEAAAIGAKLMDALDAAHRAGVLHRDVKPANVLLERGGRVVLTDFGIATMEASDGDAVTKLTQSGQIIGSIDYLPPERAQGREPGPASDIWSLGMTLYAAVEGASPFRRTSVWSTMTAIVNEPLPEPRRAGPLTPVLRALMAKDPENRPTAEQARRMLEQIAAGGTTTAAPPHIPTTAVAAPGAGPGGAGAVPPAAVPPHRPTAAVPLPGAGAGGAGAVPPPSAAVPPAAPTAVPPPGAGTMAGAGQVPSAATPPATPAAVPSPPPGFGPAPLHQQPQPPFPPQPQPQHAGYPPPGGPAAFAQPPSAPGDSRPAADRARRRRRTVIAAAAAVVLAGAGVAYALTGGYGGKSDGGAQAAPAAGSPSGSGGPNGGAAADGNAPGGSPSAQEKPSGKPSPRPSGSATGATPRASASASAKPSPVSKSCSGWSHRDPNPGTYGYMSGSYHLQTGPYENCPSVSLAKSGTKLWYHCSVVNAHGNTWIYVRVEGTKTYGWMSNDNLTRQTGPSTRC
ncbi:serine/threonine protein kinase [Streptomyces sp. SCA3-4]|uniref:serine/threonine-protein kinase n=1 Tax=Streptomyces sichuanensis TaxID=2871810 RepID=UPI001CE2518D|nr:serine/threonine-protein kinase [Streptomyces sichuanensis]MCA6093402.1 serine/threonine protein kinase [Streptomyces sichuanensis]